MALISELPAVLRRCIRTGVNLHTVGAPGIGKTEIISQVVAEIQATDPDFWFGSVYTPALNPTDFICMMPEVQTGTLKSYRNAMLPNAYETPDLRGILFLGERDNGDPATNRALQKYVNCEDMGGLRKPKGIIVVSDSNAVAHKSGAVQQSLALLSRSRFLAVDVDPDATLKYFSDQTVSPFIQAYLSLRKEHISTFDELLKSKEHKVWANPRGWERLGKSMDDADVHGEKLSHEEIIGDIGEAVGREFIAFMHAARDLVSYDDIANDPMKAALPDKLSDVYAIVAMLSATTQAKDLANVRKYVERWGAEVQVLYLRLLVSSKGKHKNECIASRSYTEWFSRPELVAALL